MGREAEDLCHANAFTTSASNRSHARANRVSLIKTRILKIRDQRLACETGARSPQKRKTGRQKLPIVLITGGNVAQIFASQTRPTGTVPFLREG
jgi:hypothetical protein